MSKTFNTPRGKFIYPHLNTPDTKFNADGVYHVKVELDSNLPEVGEMLAQLDTLYDEAYDNAVAELVESGKAKTEAVARKKVKRASRPYSYVEDEETGDDTDIVQVNFKMKAVVKSRKTGKTFKMKPDLFDAAGNAIPSKVQVYGGTIGVVAYEPYPWYTPTLGAGLTLRLKAVQVIELVSGGGGGSAASFGFAAVDGGYSAPADVADDDDDEDDFVDTAVEDDGTGDF